MASLLLFACVMWLILKMNGVAYGLCHEGCNIMFILCVCCVAKMLHLSDTSTDNARLSCCWMCQIKPWIHFKFNQLPWWSMTIVFLYVSLPFLKVFPPETSVADKHNNCMPVLSMPKDHGGVFAHPCTTCSEGKWNEWQNGDPLLCVLEEALLLFVWHKGM